MTRRTWTRTILIIAVTSSISGNIVDYASTTESSADYLRKVMLELQDMNVQPSLLPVPSAESVYFDVDDRHYLAGKRFSNSKRLRPAVEDHHEHSAFQTPILRTTGKKFEPFALDQTFSESVKHDQYYQIPGPVVLPAPQKAAAPERSPSITKAELASMYKNAIGKGSAISLNALANVLRTRLPTVPPDPVVAAPAQPMYSYYFYPLKTFMNDIRHPHSLQPVQDSKPQATGLMQETEKQAANPLFMAISGFVGMAILFMIGVLLMPKLVGDFASREEEDDFLDLTKRINEAIDKRNCTEQSDHKRIDKRTVYTTRPMARPSSVVLLTTKPVRLKDITKRRRKSERSCKIGTCKKSHRSIIT